MHTIENYADYKKYNSLGIVHSLSLKSRNSFGVDISGAMVDMLAQSVICYGRYRPKIYR
jgi:hypothetical protein